MRVSMRYYLSMDNILNGRHPMRVYMRYILSIKLKINLFDLYYNICNGQHPMRVSVRYYLSMDSILNGRYQMR